MADRVIRKEVYITPQDLTGFIVSIGGVKFWAVAIFPMYVGWVLAQPETARRLFLDDLGIVLGLVVIGPLLGTFTLLLNTYYDMGTTDTANPRKQYVEVIEDLIDRESVRYTAWGFGAIGILLAAFVSVNLVPYGATMYDRAPFFVLIALAAVLSVAYSHPSMRLKGVAGMDLLVNVIGFGVICPLAGWSLLRPVHEFPLWWLLSAALFVGASYAPTTASDYESDKAFGIRTMAVALGMGGAIRVGFVLLLAAVAILVYGGATHAFPFAGSAADALSLLWPFLAGQVAVYALFLRRPTQSKTWALILLLTILQGLTTLLFLYFFTGGQAYAR